jgi:CheY-like chemotaxis protein
MSKRILVAEDSKDLADLMRFTLDFYGYEVLLTKDGVEAVDSAIALQPDLIILDMMMPKLDGFQAVLQLRQHPETKNIPILAASALTSPSNRAKCLASGCDEHLPKPFTTKDLADAVQRLLAASEGNMRKSPAKTTVSAMM